MRARGGQHTRPGANHRAAPAPACRQQSASQSAGGLRPARYERRDKRYRDLLIKTPDDVNALGELGNVYLSVGRQRDAAEVYYEAALLLVAKKDFERAGIVAAAIRQGDPQLADDLVRRMSEAMQGVVEANARAPDAK